jgi:hypothetical protein
MATLVSSGTITIVDVNDGAAGANGTSIFVAALYQQLAGATAPALPTLTTYNFSNNQVTGTLGNWARTMPASSTVPIYMTTCTFTAIAPAITQANSAWTAAVVTAKNGEVGATGPAATMTSNRAGLFTSTDTVLDQVTASVNLSITFTMAVSGILSPTYAWTFDGLTTNPTLPTTQVNSVTVTSAQFGAAKGALVTCTVNGIYKDTIGIIRQEKSTAAPFATVGASFYETYAFDVNPNTNPSINSVVAGDFLPFKPLVGDISYVSGMLTQTAANGTAYNKIAYTRFPNTVNASSCVTGEFTTTAHEYFTDQPVTYSHTGGSPIAGLTNGGVYYVIMVSATKFKLASTLANSSSGIPVTLTESMNTSVVDVKPSALTIASDTFTSVANSFLTGMPLRYTGTLAGLLPGVTYYAIRVTATTFKVASTYANAMAATTDIVPTALGINGEFTCASNTIPSGTRMLYTATSLISGLNLTTEYYYIRVSATTFRLATTYDLAIKATPAALSTVVVPTSISTDTHIITATNSFANGMEIKPTTAVGGLSIIKSYYVVSRTATSFGLVDTLGRVTDSNANSGLTLTAQAPTSTGTTFTTSGVVPADGTEVKYITSNATALDGLVKNGFYFIKKISPTQFKLTLAKGTTVYIKLTSVPTAPVLTASSFVAPLVTLTSIIPANSKIYYPTVTVNSIANATLATFTTTFAVALNSVANITKVTFTPTITNATFTPITTRGETVSFRVPNTVSTLLAGINNSEAPTSANIFAAFEIIAVPNAGPNYNIWINGKAMLEANVVGDISANTVFTIIYTENSGSVAFYIADTLVYAGKSTSESAKGFIAAFKTMNSAIDNIVHGPAINSPLLSKNNILGRLTKHNASTFIDKGAINSAMIGSLQLIGDEFSVKSSERYGARMEMTGKVIKIFDKTSTSGTTGLRVKLGNLEA